MARLHEPAPGIPSTSWMSAIAWAAIASMFAIGGLCFAGGMGWL